MVRRGYRSIESTFREAFLHENAQELDDVLRFSCEELAEILQPMGYGQKDTHRIAGLMGATNDNGITLQEFFRGIRMFAPSCGALERVKLDLLQRNVRVADAFKGMATRQTVLDCAGLARLLEQAGAQASDAQPVMDLLDIRTIGVITYSEFIAALQCLQPGVQKKETKAEQHVKHDLAPIHRRASDLRLQVKQGYMNNSPEARVAAAVHATSMSGVASGPVTVAATEADEEDTHPHPEGQDSSQNLAVLARVGVAAKAAPRTTVKQVEQRQDIENMAMARTTFQRITSSLSRLPPDKQVEKPISEELTNYFGSAQKTLTKQAPLLHEVRSRRISIIDPVRS